MTVISVENISKQYRLGVIGGATFREEFNRWWANKRGKPDPYAKIGEPDHGNRDGEHIWALRDVSFQVKEGEILRIIGRNGAGKSTLLKILSRIVAPTSGCIKVKGRVASLLEVGTGFHQELTGRENIYLNGAILGMTKSEISRKLEEIIVFSEIESYIDTPVKRYSSGMKVRLAFSVAAHLEPEILVVDEVLAVGDAAFQKKCLGKMEDVSRQGRTVLFVSHNMGMVTSLCQTGVLLSGGEVTFQGTAAQVVNTYFSVSGGSSFEARFDGVGDKFAELICAHVENKSGATTGEVDIREDFRIRMTYRILTDTPVAPYPNFHFYDTKGDCVFVTAGCEDARKKSSPGVYTATCIVPGYLLNANTYFVGLALTFTKPIKNVSFYEKGALSFTVVDPIDDGSDGDHCGYRGAMPGAVRPKLAWIVESVS